MRIYIEKIINNELKLNQNQRHYLKNVMRSPSHLLVFNAKDGEYKATLQGDRLVVGEQVRAPQVLPYKALAFGLIKSACMSWMFEKATELGVTHFYPLVCDRSQYKDFNADRYEKIVIEATEQCGRCDKPVIMPLTTCVAFVACLVSRHCEERSDAAIQKNAQEGLDYFVTDVPRNDEQRSSVPKEATWHYGDPEATLTLSAISSPYGVIIGPEGGFSPQERTCLAEHLQDVKLGAHILRAETAAIVAMSAVF